MIRTAFALTILLLTAPVFGRQEVTIDPNSGGRIFEGLGALSAGASSRLLIEYPEPYRSNILDYLFKPYFGAAFNHLKVEIGGNVNSTDGTEPAHAHNRCEFANPRRQYYERGYEWWLMREARKRNPDIKLDILQWGAPGWVGNGNFYSQENADFIAAFIKGAKEFHGLDIDYCGIWNEQPYDTSWIKRLRRTLDHTGLEKVGIVAADEIQTWHIAEDMARDKRLMDAVSVIGVHYPGSPGNLPRQMRYNSTEQAKDTGKPLWSSEDGPWHGGWRDGAPGLIKSFNRNYIAGKMTKTIIWSLATSYYENLPIPNSGPMKANTPWSGHYEVQPAIWVIAHTTQFAKPGWHYIDSACALLAGGGSFVTLRNPETGDYSIIIETFDANCPQTVSFMLEGNLSDKPVHIWRSNLESQFDNVDTLSIQDRTFALALDPCSIYSATTTTGQKKGQAENPIPSGKAFPFPYREDFENYAPGKMARYFSDQGGIFEVAERKDEKGKCLRQICTERGIDWPFHHSPAPETLLGDLNWQDYEVSVDCLIEGKGYAAVYGRVGQCQMTSAPPAGYRFEIDQNGNWTFSASANQLAWGKAEFAPDDWHNLKLRFKGDVVAALVDGAQVLALKVDLYKNGMAGIGCGYHTAVFDDFSVTPFEEDITNVVPAAGVVNLAQGATVAVSSRRGQAQTITDGRDDTRWTAIVGDKENWVEIDFGRPTEFNKVLIKQFRDFISVYSLQYHDGQRWVYVLADAFDRFDYSFNSFPTVRSQKLKLRIEQHCETPSIREIEVYRCDNPQLR